ncbi:MAG: hypothetical protein ACOVJ8_06555 [Sediminibacterium sp.]
MSGGISDSAYERSEDAVIKTEICEYCEGKGELYYCGECDENIEACECGTLQDKKSQICYDCNGEGVVQL